MARRRLLAILAFGSVLAVVSCQRLLGFEHGVPAREECGACALGGESQRGGEGGAPEPTNGGAIAGGGAPLEAGSDAGGKDAGGAGVGGRDAAGGAAGGSVAGGATAGGRGGQGDGGGKSGGGGRGVVTECSPDVCPNPDPEHCTVVCSTTEEAFNCVVAPRDGDGDRHGDARCVAPGDDCDDTKAAVEPGASETCDGIDNDCNGKRDLEDGFVLSAKDEALPDEEGSLLFPAYSPEAGRFLMAWAPEPGLRSEPGVAYQVVDLAGNVTREGYVPSDDGEVVDLSLAAGAGGFAIFWANVAGAYFQRISGEGELGTSTTVTTGDVRAVALAHASVGGWTAFWLDSDVRARRVGQDDALGPVVVNVSGGGNPPIAAVSAGDAFVVLVPINEFASATLIPHTLVGGRSLELGADGDGQPIHAGSVAGRPEGYGVIGGNFSGQVFQIFDPTGVRRCGPVPLREGVSYRTIAPSVNGFVLVGHVALDEYDLDCQVRQRAPSSAISVPGVPRLASAGAEGFLLTWYTYDSGFGPIGWRRFGPHFCD